MSVKKRHIFIYLEFFKDVDVAEIEKKIRGMVKKGVLPPINKGRILIDHKGLKRIEKRDRVYPFILNPKTLEIIENEAKP